MPVIQHALALSAPSKPFELSDESKQRYRKQLIYTGDFKKGDRTIDVAESDIDHWVATGTQMLEAGADIPLPVEHTTDPEKKRGSIVGFEKDATENGTVGLYGIVEFNDPETAKQHVNSDVSIYSPPTAEHDGKSYDWPITHVALTNYPVVPRLNGFEAIAASLVLSDPPNLEPKKMPLKSLAGKLGVSIPDGADDAAIEKAIVTAFKKKPEPTEPKKPVAVAASLINMAKDNRDLKLSRLVEKGNVTPNVKKQLAEIFMQDDAISLSLQSDPELAVDDKFDQLIIALSENNPVELGEQSGIQAISLSDITDADKNPLLADAESRLSS